MPAQLTFADFQNTQPPKLEILQAKSIAIYSDGYTIKPPSITTPFKLISGLPGLFPVDFSSSVIDVPKVEVETFDPKQIPFDIKGDPNEEMWKAVREGNVDRDKIFCEYKSLGETIKIEGDRGIPDLNKKRLLNFQQHFTPTPIARFIAQALRLDLPGTPASVVDNSCGIGRMFQFLAKDCVPVGIEVEEKAFHMAKMLFPKAHIINDDLVNHPHIVADYFIINPPFSIQLGKKNSGFENSGWGPLGPNSSIKSHIAALEAAIKGARYYVAAMLPQGYFTNEDTFTFEQWVNRRASLIYRLDIDEKAFKPYGFSWPCSVVIYSTWKVNDWKPIHSKITSLDPGVLSMQLNLLRGSEEGLEIDKAIEHIRKHGFRDHTRLVKWVPEQPPQIPLKLQLTGTNKVKFCLSPDSSRINTKVDNLLTALKLHEFKEAMGKEWNQGLRDYTKNGDVRLRRRNILEDPGSIMGIANELRKANIQIEIDPQLVNWQNKKLKWLERQMAPFEQWIKKDGEWVLLHEDDGIKSLFPELYQQRLSQLKKLGITWLWDFQASDVARISMKDSTLLCDHMGLGKTRQIIATALILGVKHSLILVEPKLVDEFVTEFKTLGIKDYQVIRNEGNLKTLKKLNLIAYNLLWRPVKPGRKKTFAKAMRRRFQFVAADEAHKIKAKDSEQGMAVKVLKARYKLLSTGTPIANYPRNIFNLLTFGWGDGTERNHYGFYAPIERTENGSRSFGFTTGTRQFKEDFITISWVTEQFASSLSKGAKSREVPKLKDPAKWWAMMAPKMIRRLRDEPEVSPFIKIPTPEISTEMIKMSPEQITHYRFWLDNFASWFKEQLRMEKEEGHKIDQMMVLAHLTQLQFASTIPQSPKTNNGKSPWAFGLTTKQKRVLEIAKEAVEKGDKIIVFSERPEFQRFMQEILFTKYRIKAHLFVGDQGIKERNILLDDFRHNGIQVLLATTTCGENGLNIPEANIVVIADTSWTPSKQKQAYSRILRPQQKKLPKIYLLRAVGTIDEYMGQLCQAKDEAIDEGLDYQDAPEFDSSKWLSYRDFTIKMLRAEGYSI